MTQESFEVTVPEGAGPGSVLRLTLPSGELVEIPVPEGAVPGDKLSFELSKSSLQAVEMALSGEQVIFPGKVSKGKSSSALPPLMELAPVGPGPRSRLSCHLVGWWGSHPLGTAWRRGGCHPVPEGSSRRRFYVEAPKGTSKVDVVIPDDATPGAQSSLTSVGSL